MLQVKVFKTRIRSNPLRSFHLLPSRGLPSQRVGAGAGVRPRGLRGGLSRRRELPAWATREAVMVSDDEAQASNRWARIAPFFLIQGVTGSVYAWSVYNAPLTQSLGVIAPASGDWALGDVLPLFSVSAAVLGVVTATLGPTIDRIGPRISAFLSAGFWTVGLGLSSFACQIHSLPLLAAGYGLCGGIGWGFGYVGPISGLLSWFPDKRGLVQGLGMTSFGMGSLIAPVVAQKLISLYSKAPTLVPDPQNLVTQDGVRFAEIGGELREVVVTASSDAARGIVEGGVYLVGTGDSGVGMTFGTLALAYGSLLSLAAVTVRMPPNGFHPKSSNSEPAAAAAAAVEAPEKASEAPKEAKVEVVSGAEAQPEPKELDVTAGEALKTKQFWLLLGTMTGNSVAGLGIISCGKLLMSDCFMVAMPEIVTPAACALFVSTIAGANTLGRLGWGMAGDKIGRRNTLLAFAASAPACALLPSIIAAASTMPSLGTLPLIGFVTSMVGIIACYGGLFAVIPAYVADIFGARHAGAIMGRLLCGYSAAAIAGPGLLAGLRSRGDWLAVQDLSKNVDAAVFERVFGTSVANLHELWEKKTVTIQNLLSLVPPELGITDPTHTLYASTFYIMAGVLGSAAACTWATSPLSKAVVEKIYSARKLSS